MESQALLISNRSDNLPTVTCPNCNVMWLAPGLLQGDTYECRSCGLGFVVGKLSRNNLRGSDSIGLDGAGS